MKIKLFFLIITLIFSANIYAQKDLNNYKYVIVPFKYDFLNDADKYQLNSLTKFLFNKNHFNALMNNEIYPNDLAQNGCLALNADVVELKGLFKTKLKVTLKNCNNEVVFVSEIGEAREEDFTKAYHMALRDAFKSIEKIDYKYDPVENEVILISADQQEGIKPVVNKNDPPLEGTSNSERILPKNLYAQVIKNGFQLVDSDPKIIYKIKTTSLADVYLVEGMQAILYKIEGDWVIEFYENDSLKTKKLNIKF